MENNGKKKVEHDDIIWSEHRNKIFLERFSGDLNKLRREGYTDNQALKMIYSMDYVKFFLAWPEWAFPVTKLPKGYKWSDGKKYYKKGGKRSFAETWYFLIAGDDLYIKCGNGSPFMPGMNINESQFVRIINFRVITAVDFLSKINISIFFDDCIHSFWNEQGLRQGYVEPVLRELC